jgi:hypothetical protein
MSAIPESVNLTVESVSAAKSPVDSVPIRRVILLGQSEFGWLTP